MSDPTQNQLEKSKGNDLEIYDEFEPWWNDSNRQLRPLRRLAPERKRFLQEKVMPQGRILDLGCGGGYMLEELSGHKACLFGIDLAIEALRAAKTRSIQKGYATMLTRASADALPFPDAYFDGIICTDVLVHVPDPQAVICEIARVLKPNGWLHVSAINKTWLAKFVMITLGEGLLRMIPKGTHDARTFISPNRLSQMLAAQGLQLNASSGIGPTGWSKGAFTFGVHRSQSVMYQGFALNTNTLT